MSPRLAANDGAVEYNGTRTTAAAVAASFGGWWWVTVVVVVVVVVVGGWGGGALCWLECRIRVRGAKQTMGCSSCFSKITLNPA
jgi:hypothetical protein